SFYLRLAPRFSPPGSARITIVYSMGRLSTVSPHDLVNQFAPPVAVTLADRSSASRRMVERTGFSLVLSPSVLAKDVATDQVPSPELAPSSIGFARRATKTEQPVETSCQPLSTLLPSTS